MTFACAASLDMITDQAETKITQETQNLLKIMFY